MRLLVILDNFKMEMNLNNLRGIEYDHEHITFVEHIMPKLTFRRISPCSCRQRLFEPLERLNFWDDVFGFRSNATDGLKVYIKCTIGAVEMSLTSLLCYALRLEKNIGSDPLIPTIWESILQRQLSRFPLWQCFWRLLHVLSNSCSLDSFMQIEQSMVPPSIPHAHKYNDSLRDFSRQ